MRSRDSVVYTPVSLGPDTDDEETLVDVEVYKSGELFSTKQFDAKIRIVISNLFAARKIPQTRAHIDSRGSHRSEGQVGRDWKLRNDAEFVSESERAPTRLPNSKRKEIALHVK